MHAHTQHTHTGGSGGGGILVTTLARNQWTNVKDKIKTFQPNPGPSSVDYALQYMAG